MTVSISISPPVSTGSASRYIEAVRDSVAAAIRNIGDLERISATLKQFLEKVPAASSADPAFYQAFAERIRTLQASTPSPATTITASPGTGATTSSARPSSLPVLFSSAAVSEQEALTAALQDYLQTFAFMTSLEKVAYVHTALQERIVPGARPPSPERTRKRGYQEGIDALLLAEDQTRKQLKMAWTLSEFIPEARLAEVIPPVQALLFAHQDKIRLLLTGYGVTFHQLTCIPFPSLEMLLETDTPLFVVPSEGTAPPEAFFKQGTCVMGVLLRRGIPLDRLFEVALLSGDTSGKYIVTLLKDPSLLRALIISLTYDLHESPPAAATAKTIAQWLNSIADFQGQLPKDPTIAPSLVEALKAIRERKNREIVISGASHFKALADAGIDVAELANDVPKQLLFLNASSIGRLLENYGITKDQVSGMPDYFLSRLLEAGPNSLSSLKTGDWKEQPSPFGILLQLGVPLETLYAIAHNKKPSPGAWFTWLFTNPVISKALYYSLSYDLYERPNFAEAEATWHWLLHEVYSFYKDLALDEDDTENAGPVSKSILALPLREDRKTVLQHRELFFALEKAGLSFQDSIALLSYRSASPLTVAIPGPRTGSDFSSTLHAGARDWLSFIQFLLRSGKITAEELKNLPDSVKRLVIRNAASVVALLNAGIALPSLINMPPDEKELEQMAATRIIGGTNTDRHVLHETNGWVYSTQEFLIRYGKNVALLLSYMTFEQVVLLARHPSKRFYIIYGSSLVHLAKQGTPFAELMTLEQEPLLEAIAAGTPSAWLL